MGRATGITASSELRHDYYPSSSRFIRIPYLQSHFPDSFLPTQSLQNLPLILNPLLRRPNPTQPMPCLGYSTSSRVCKLPEPHLATHSLCSFGKDLCLRLVPCAVNLLNGKITQGFLTDIQIFDRRPVGVGRYGDRSEDQLP